MTTKSAAQKSDYAPLETAQEALAKGRDAAREAVSMGREAAQQAVDKGREAVLQRVDSASQWASTQTKSNPLRTLGIAVIVGAVVGLLIARR